MKHVFTLLVVSMALGLVTVAWADLGFGLDAGGGVTVLNNSRLLQDRGDEQRFFQHGTGMGFVATPRLFIGYKADNYFIGAEFDYSYSETTLEYDVFMGEEDYEVRRKMDNFRIGAAFDYYFLTGKIQPYLLAGLAFLLTESDLYDNAHYDQTILEFDTGYGVGASVGFGVDFKVKETTSLGLGIRADGSYYVMQAYKKYRLRDQFYQVPVSLYFRASFGLGN